MVVSASGPLSQWTPRRTHFTIGWILAMKQVKTVVVCCNYHQSAPAGMQRHPVEQDYGLRVWFSQNLQTRATFPMGGGGLGTIDCGIHSSREA